ncbi:MAG: sigma-70 family RNA polymerase sigma factor [Clostridiales bacterium]|nr:sigma-70 family RNA polymerase sigma factor [Clostridiales bacterium]
MKSFVKEFKPKKHRIYDKGETMNYQMMTDEQLVALSKNDKGLPFETLIKRYDSVIKVMVGKFFCSDADRDDLTQICLVALTSAVDKYNGQSNFKAFAYACINNALLSAFRKSNTKKNSPLKNYVPLFGYGDGDSDKNDVIVDTQIGPEESLIVNEVKAEFKAVAKDTLSELEFNILDLILQGYSYKEISVKTNKDIKSIDNAVQRIRKKLKTKLGDV